MVLWVGRLVIVVTNLGNQGLGNWRNLGPNWLGSTLGTRGHGKEPEGTLRRGILRNQKNLRKGVLGFNLEPPILEAQPKTGEGVGTEGGLKKL